MNNNEQPKPNSKKRELVAKIKEIKSKEEDDFNFEYSTNMPEGAKLDVYAITSTIMSIIFKDFKFSADERELLLLKSDKDVPFTENLLRLEIAVTKILREKIIEFFTILDSNKEKDNKILLLIEKLMNVLYFYNHSFSKDIKTAGRFIVRGIGTAVSMNYNYFRIAHALAEEKLKRKLTATEIDVIIQGLKNGLLKEAASVELNVFLKNYDTDAMRTAIFKKLFFIDGNLKLQMYKDVGNFVEAQEPKDAFGCPAIFAQTTVDGKNISVLNLVSDEILSALKETYLRFAIK